MVTEFLAIICVVINATSTCNNVNDDSNLDWYKIAGIIGGGGLVGTILTLLYNSRATKRQEIVDMSKFRMVKISRKVKSYLCLTKYSNVLSARFNEIHSQRDLLNDSIFLSRTFYALIKFLQISYRILMKEDSIVLGNQAAESVLVNLHGLAYSSFVRIYGPIDIEILRKILPEDETFDALDRILASDDEARNYYNSFIAWISDFTNNDVVMMIHVWLFCLSEILMYELNLVFQRWYDEPFYVSTHLNPRCLKYIEETPMFPNANQSGYLLLREQFPRYYSRLYSKMKHRTFWESRRAL